MTVTLPAAAVYVCPPEHKHAVVGTCYVLHKCRCADCRQANATRESHRTRQKAYGRYVLPYVDATAVRAHVEFLRAHGMGYKTIAQRAGVGPTGVRKLIYGREDYQNGTHGPRHGEQLQRVGRHLADKILAVQPTLNNLPSTAHVSARGTVRRIQALVAFGYSQADLSRRLGILDTNLSKLRLRYEESSHRDRIVVQAATALAVTALYDRISSTPPAAGTHREKISVARARRMGLERRWPLPMDWESNENDFDAVHPVRRSVA